MNCLKQEQKSKVSRDGIGRYSICLNVLLETDIHQEYILKQSILLQVLVRVTLQTEAKQC